MEVKTNKLDGANISIEVEMSEEFFEKKIEKLAKNICKTVKIAGFRQGKVPVSVVKSRFAESLEQDAQKEIFSDVLVAAKEKHEEEISRAIGNPRIVKYDKSDGKRVMEIVVGIAPVINLDNIDSLIPEFEEASVGDEEVEKRLEGLALASVPAKKIEEDRELRDGDIAVIDFKGFLDGEPFERGEAKGHELKVGSGSFIDGFEPQIVGMKVGEEREIEVKFPEAYAAANLAGKDVKFEVKLNEIKIKEMPPLDGELAKKMLPDESEPTIDMVKERIKEQIKSEKMSGLYNDELKPKVLEAFSTKLEFDLPSAVVDQEMDLAFQNELRTLNAAEVERLQANEEEFKAKRELHREDAIKSVKVTFVINELAKLHKIEATNDELSAVITDEARMYGKDPQELLNMYDKAGYIPALRMSIVQDKLISYLLDKKLKG